MWQYVQGTSVLYRIAKKCQEFRRERGSHGMRAVRYLAEVAAWTVVWAVIACWIATGIAVWRGL